MWNCRWASEVNGRIWMKCTSPARVIARDRVPEIDIFFRAAIISSRVGIFMALVCLDIME